MYISRVQTQYVVVIPVVSCIISYIAVSRRFNTLSRLASAAMSATAIPATQAVDALYEARKDIAERFPTLTGNALLKAALRAYTARFINFLESLLFDVMLICCLWREVRDVQ